MRRHKRRQRQRARWLRDIQAAPSLRERPWSVQWRLRYASRRQLRAALLDDSTRGAYVAGNQ